MNGKFDELHKGIPARDLRITKEKLKKEGTGGFQLDRENSREKLKEEINAITSLLTEEAWAAVHEWIKSHPNEVIVSKTKKRNAEAPMVAMTDSELLKKTFNQKYNDEELFMIDLQEITFHTILSQIKTWESHKYKTDLGEKEQSLWERYRYLLEKRDGKGDFEVAFEIGRGLGTAANTMWMVLLSIPVVYRKQFGKPISEKEYEEIAQRAITLIIKIAQLHLDQFGFLDRKYSKPLAFEYGRPTAQVPRYEKFLLSNESGKLTLDLDEKTFVKNKEDPSDPVKINIRTGCPAIFSKGTGAKNVIAEMYDYVLDLNRRLHIPYLKERGLVEK